HPAHQLASRYTVRESRIIADMLSIQGSAADELLFKQDRPDPGPHEINAGRKAGRASSDNYRFIGIAHTFLAPHPIAYHVRGCKDSPFNYPDPLRGCPRSPALRKTFRTPARKKAAPGKTFSKRWNRSYCKK